MANEASSKLLPPSLILPSLVRPPRMPYLSHIARERLGALAEAGAGITSHSRAVGVCEECAPAARVMRNLPFPPP